LGGGSPLQFADRAHFFAVVAQAMRRVLVDHARCKLAAKRDGSGVPDSEWMVSVPDLSDERLLALDEALTALSAISPRPSRVVELRYFAGLSEEQIASVLGVNRRTVCRDWQIARAWLHSKLEKA
jgi:RNA polymerase sigma factor (TIGR02999 family)